MPDPDIIAAETLLRSGVRSTKQGRYARRLPAREASRDLNEARRILLLSLQRRPDAPHVLAMLSQILECLLDYEQAIDYLTRAFQHGHPRTQKELRRLALLREASEEWKTLRLSPEELDRLGRFLTEIGVGPEDRSFNFTRKWLVMEGVDSPEDVIAALQKRGAFTDFQVLANVVRG